VPVEMRGPGDGPGVSFARAEIVLAEALPAAKPTLPDLSLPPYGRTREQFYQQLLFHGPDLQGIESVEGSSPDGITGIVATAPAPGGWMRQPLRTAWLADPLALDSAFQLMVLWCAEHQGAVSLPCYVGSYRQFQRTFPSEGTRVVARVTEKKGQRVLAAMEF